MEYQTQQSCASYLIVVRLSISRIISIIVVTVVAADADGRLVLIVHRIRRGLRRRCGTIAKLGRIFGEIRMQQQLVARPTARRILVDAFLQEIHNVRILQAFRRHFGLERLKRHRHRQCDALRTLCN